ncbi:LOW QUALITY PROTEIN: hypothetical protein PHMEG_00023331 [Phytophthora megakarya]|uniref:C2H2-type domain-containing protein n=1 Tax=Phytophthora megakarya TaxID=4795 RepID=A0A225VJM2_9STRA|nr:LOW QUALITY PROTEIN: hypothetical protein PHMEG_00023331 [Phytophthora megakarya]
MAPAMVAAYSIAMNGVDCVDHVRCTNPSMRKEQRLSMCLLTWVLDLSLINASALMQQIRKEQTDREHFENLKYEFVNRLSHLNWPSQKRNALKRNRSEATPSYIPDREELHILTPNSRERSSGKLVCHLCRLQGIKTTKSSFGCTKCEVGFRVECFAVAHFKDAFHNVTPNVAAVLQAPNNAGNGKPSSKPRKRINNSITSLDELTKRTPCTLPQGRLTPCKLSPRAGYVGFHDKQPVVFYTNDLASTPSARVLDGENSEAISCCHGLYPIRRWTENRVLYRKTFMAPAMVAAYSIAMNGVDCVDHVRCTNPSMRKEQRLSMCLLTWVLDLSLINASALMQQIRKEQTDREHFENLKYEFVNRLSHLNWPSQKRNALKRNRSEATPSYIPDREELHILTPNSRERSSGKLVCHLCRLQGIKTTKSSFGCTKCEVGFRVECFAVAHFKDAFHNVTPNVAAVLQAPNNAGNGKPSSKPRKRINNSITSLDELVLRK